MPGKKKCLRDALKCLNDWRGDASSNVCFSACLGAQIKIKKQDPVNQELKKHMSPPQDADPAQSLPRRSLCDSPLAAMNGTCPATGRITLVAAFLSPPFPFILKAAPLGFSVTRIFKELSLWGQG